MRNGTIAASPHSAFSIHPSAFPQSTRLSYFFAHTTAHTSDGGFMQRKWIVSIVLLGVFVLSGFSRAADRRPNIIIILSDDMGFSDLGCYGSEIQTPNLDSLAAGGLRFTQFYNTARCCPTRASLLTGLYPHQAGVGYMTDRAEYSAKAMINEWYSGDLRPDTATIAEVMRGAGYS